MSSIYISVLLTCIAFILVAHIKPLKDNFYLGTGQYGSWVSGISIVAAFTGGGALINTTMLASKYGVWAFFDVFPAVIGLGISAIFASVGFFGKHFSENFFDIQGDIYDRRAVGIHYAQIAFLYVLVIAAQFRAVATVAEQMHVSVWLAVLFCAATVAVYAFKGFNAVTKTDVLQVILMVPMYIVIALMAFESSSIPQTDISNPSSEMPLSLIIALCLPFIFLPISQELHQRGATVVTDKNVIHSRLIASLVYAALGSLLVFSFSQNPNLSFANVISGKNTVAAIIIAVGLVSAILSTLDTSTNIASHALQKLPSFSQLSPAIAQIILLLIGVSIFLFFKTILAIILFALFLYMAGPAFTFIGIYAGIHPRYCAAIGAIFSSLQAFFHFEGGKLLKWGIAENIPLSDPVIMGISLLLVQAVVLIILGVRRRLS